jgi:proteasome alpha subunit
MRDEPYRWIEAIQDRRDYIEDELRLGSPVVGVTYDEGMMLLTVSKGQRKIFEVHDRIALSAIGHPADIERLRMLVTDTASVQGFQNATEDINLNRLTNYTLAPAFKQAFESIAGEAYIIKMLLAELGSNSGKDQFTGINFDGIVRTDPSFAVIGGTEVIETGMQKYLTAAKTDTDRDLTTAFRLALETWAIGKELSSREPEEAESEETQIETTQMYEIIDTAREEGEIEVGVLETAQQGTSKFRLLTPQEIEDALS